METMYAWYGMTRPSLSKSKHGMTSEGRVRGAELASVLGYLYPFVEKRAHRRRKFMVPLEPLETAWLLRDRSPSRVPRRQDSQVSLRAASP